MSKTDSGTNKYERFLYEAAAGSAYWYGEVEEARNGVAGAPTMDTARGKLHAKVMMYWTLLERYKDEATIQSKWHDETVNGYDFTLEELRKMRLQTMERSERVWNPDTGAEEVHTVEEPWQMPPEMAIAVRSQLDRCAAALGVDMDIEKEKTYPEPV